MENQMIGVASVFAMTFFLFVLRHCLLSLGRPKRSGYVNPTTLRRDYESNIESADDHAWLLWSPELDAQAGPPKRGFGERHKAL